VEDKIVIENDVNINNTILVTVDRAAYATHTALDALYGMQQPMRSKGGVDANDLIQVAILRNIPPRRRRMEGRLGDDRSEALGDEDAGRAEMLLPVSEVGAEGEVGRMHLQKISMASP
jgi:hypothetical protein